MIYKKLGEQWALKFKKGFLISQTFPICNHIFMSTDLDLLELYLINRFIANHVHVKTTKVHLIMLID